MGVMEIVLIVLGVIVFIGSFLLPAGKKTDTQESEKISEDTIREMVGREVEDAKSQISDIVDETITYAIEKTERSMDRLTNEKMMAVNEYSDTVLEEINKNHKEVVFLYDMLNDKHENLKTTVSQAAKTVSEVKQTVKDVEVLAKETESILKEPEHTGNDGGVSRTETILEKTEFTPITPMQVKVDMQPEVEKAQKEEGKAGGNERKSRTVKAAKQEISLDVPADGNERKNRSTGAAGDVLPDIPELEIAPKPAGRAGGRNSNERILELHKAGKSNMAIAKELGLGIGEVKLVIDLFEGL